MATQLQNRHKARIALVVFVSVVALIFYWRLGPEDIPGDVDVKTGNYRLEDGQFKEAEKEFKKALGKNQDHVLARLGLGITYMQLKRYDEALAEFDRAIELDPDNAISWADRGILHDRVGRHEKALSDYKKALTIDAEAVEGPGFLWRFMRNISEMPPQIKDRAIYLQKEMAKPADQRLLSLPDEDKKQRMHK